MATYITNNPERDPDMRDGSGTGVVAGILITALVVILFFVFGLPYIRGTGSIESPGVPATGGSFISSSSTERSSPSMQSVSSTTVNSVQNIFPGFTGTTTTSGSTSIGY